MQLPADFLRTLQDAVGKDREALLSLYDAPPFRGFSVNRLKTTPEKLLPLLPFPAERSSFSEDHYTIPSNVEGIGRLALHAAGAFYVQEPSASSAVTLLSPSPGEKILDLCAAPGGKSAQIASRLGRTGLIWSNEIVRSRAQILLSNFERMGIAHGVVSCAHPDVLCASLAGWFDRVLVDAPCSGEGMFRKEPAAVEEWSLEHTKTCARRQLAILKTAVRALKKGGRLVYSTCTFSCEENEGVVARFLEECPDMEVLPPPEIGARPAHCPGGLRITPLEGGEGHFAIAFVKTGGLEEPSVPRREEKKISRDVRALSEAFLRDVFFQPPDLPLWAEEEKLFLLPDGLPDGKKRGIIRAGVPIGTIVKGRIEPAHGLFTAFPAADFRRCADFHQDDPLLSRFFHGEEIPWDGEAGYTAVAVEGMTVGFGKSGNGTLKNKYPKGLRW